MVSNAYLAPFILNPNLIITAAEGGVNGTACDRSRNFSPGAKGLGGPVILGHSMSALSSLAETERFNQGQVHFFATIGPVA